VNDDSVLHSPLRLGSLRLANRVVMAPMTRMRAGPDNVPTPMNAAYYAQRASAGLIVAEGTAVSEAGRGYPSAPGIYSNAQIEGWKVVTAAVHAAGGCIVLQIAHNGRNSHSSFMPDGGVPVAPSAIAPNLPGYSSDARQVPIEIPRALTPGEITQIVETFHDAAANAMTAGFDGVEIQAANSHLIDQFLEDGSNVRTDRYGGSIGSRARLLLEIVDRVAAAIGPDRLGVRLSPFGHYGGISDSNPIQLFSHVISELDARKIAYVHLIEGRASEAGLGDGCREDALNNARLFRSLFAGPVISAAGYTPATAIEALERGTAEAIAFGRAYIANPDLFERIAQSRPLNAYDRSTFYGGDATGYLDYPVFGSDAVVKS
jgi:N-ethylmaleimide reductase